MWAMAMALLAGAAGAGPARGEGPSYRVYVGTYTGGGAGLKSEGIYAMDLDAKTGRLGEPKLAVKASDPSFLAAHPNHRFLYAVSESGPGVGSVAAFAIEPETGALRPINTQPSKGHGPCQLIVDAAGKNALTANYGSGGIACLPIGADGALKPASAFVQHEGHSVNRDRQAGPHAHSVNLDPANRFVLAADLGLDRVMIYRFDAEHGKLAPNDPPFAAIAPGAGPRHFAFHPDGRHAYLITEMGNTIVAFEYDADRGALKELQTVSALPADFQGTSYCSEILVHPSGKYLYGSNRGHDSIAIFRVDAETGRLTGAGHEMTRGKNPRNFALSPDGRFLFAENLESDSIVVFEIDEASGALRPTGQSVTVAKPSCIRIVPRPGDRS